MKETTKCPWWRVGGHCDYGNNRICTSSSDAFFFIEQPEPEKCLDYQCARAEKAEKRVAELERHWHDVSEENFRALWEEYAMCPDGELDEKARELKGRLREVVGIDVRVERTEKEKSE